MAKKRKRARRWSRAVTGALGFCLWVGAGGFLVGAVNDFATWRQLKLDIAANEVLLEETKAEQEELETTRKNLTNPDYLEFVARGKYHVSRYGEQVFVFPELSEGGSDSAASSGSSDQPAGQ